jgi:hypothetical protein
VLFVFGSVPCETAARPTTRFRCRAWSNINHRIGRFVGRFDGRL